MLRQLGFVCVAVWTVQACLSEGVAWGQASEPASAAVKKTDALSPDEQLIRQAAVKFVEAYNAKDAAAIGALFGIESRLEEKDGPVIEGREAIQAAFAQSFKENPKAAISVAMDSLRFITPDVAVEEGATEFFPDGETHTSSSRYIVAHLKKDGVWRMASVRTLNEEVLSNYEYLRDLEWLVGDWIDEGAVSVIETSCRFNANKSFLLQDFQVRTNGKVTLKGTQRIGWDPIARQFRGWIFDSEGGFGEARWTRVGDAWVVKASGVGSDGTAASATRTLTRLDTDHIIVNTTDRLAGSERLPDFEITMARKAPVPQDVAASK